MLRPRTWSSQALHGYVDVGVEKSAETDVFRFVNASVDAGSMADATDPQPLIDLSADLVTARSWYGQRIAQGLQEVGDVVDPDAGAGLRC